MTIMLTTKREKEVLDNIVEIIKDLVNPEKIYLFGSRVKGTASYYSDFDLGIEANLPAVNKLEELKERIDGVAGLYSVDLVFLKDAETDFINVIKKMGVVVYER